MTKCLDGPNPCILTKANLKEGGTAIGYFLVMINRNTHSMDSIENFLEVVVLVVMVNRNSY